MKKFYLYFQLLFASIFIVSCSNDEDSFDKPYIGNWKGQTEVNIDFTDYIIEIPVEFSLSKNGRFKQKFGGGKLTDEEKGDGYTLNRGSYTVENDTILLQFDYEETKYDSSDDGLHYVDKKESDGNWYRYNLNDGWDWEEYSEFYDTSPKFIKVSENKYLHVYLYGEEERIHLGKWIWKMSTPNELTIFTYKNEFMFKLYRK